MAQKKRFSWNWIKCISFYCISPLSLNSIPLLHLYYPTFLFWLSKVHVFSPWLTRHPHLISSNLQLPARSIQFFACWVAKSSWGLVVPFLPRYGCFQKQWYTQIIHLNRVFHYKPSILRYQYIWKHPYLFWGLYFCGRNLCDYFGSELQLRIGVDLAHPCCTQSVSLLENTSTTLGSGSWG